MLYIFATVALAILIMLDTISSPEDSRSHPANPYTGGSANQPQQANKSHAVRIRARACDKLRRLLHPYKNPYQLRPYRPSHRRLTAPGEQQRRRPSNPIAHPTTRLY